MLDLNFIRQNPDQVKKGLIAKQLESKIVDQVLDLDEKRRKLLKEIETLRAKRNQIAQEGKVSPEGKAVKQQLQKLEPDLKKAEETLFNLLKQIPNLPAPDVKIGKNESENEIIKKWGEAKKFNFAVKDHLELGKILDLLDAERAAKVSGARFAYFKNEAVLLEFALIQLALKILIKEGFIPLLPPVLMRVPVFQNLGYSEHLGNEEYYLVKGGDREKSQGEEEGEYYLIGTAEHAIVPYYQDEILKEGDLPKRFVGFSTAFRREAGSYGKDTKGILRVHQFDKVEMIAFTKPEDSDKEHEYFLSLEEKLVQSLKIPYRVVKMCSGDLGAPAARKYDLECWIPSQNKYRETHSTSNCTDYQARRLNIKYQTTKDQSPTTNYVHILNGTAFAIGRTLIAILENYQQEDGSVLIPEVLRDYTGFEKISPPNSR